MGITGITEVVTCEHRPSAFVSYIRNDGVLPPVLWIESVEPDSVITLTNQVIRISCRRCFQEITREIYSQVPKVPQ
jgi:hypothetical protein